MESGLFLEELCDKLRISRSGLPSSVNGFLEAPANQALRMYQQAHLHLGPQSLAISLALGLLQIIHPDFAMVRSKEALLGQSKVAPTTWLTLLEHIGVYGRCLLV